MSHVSMLREHRWLPIKTTRNMATKITIAGKELSLAYTLHTAVSYEKMTGKNALDLSEFQNNEVAPIVDLGYCMLVCSNPADQVPDYEAFMKEFDNFEKVTEFIKAVTTELAAFYKPTVADAADPNQEDAGKNA